MFPFFEVKPSGVEKGEEKGEGQSFNWYLWQSWVLDLSQACCPPNLYESCMKNHMGFSTV